MPSGFQFDPGTGQMKFLFGTRTMLSAPDGTLVNLLPTEYTWTNQDFAYPDASKARMYTHQWFINRPPASYNGNETGRCFVTALPQEYSAQTTLMAVPTGCDVFAAQVKLARTVSPSHSWMGSAINKMVPENVWIPLTGSLLLEAHLGFSRSMSIFIDGGNLVVHRQQSIGAAPGGYGAFGAYGYGAFNNIGNFNTGVCGETVSNGTNGWPVYYPGDTGAPHYLSRFYPLSEADPFGASLWFPPTSYRASGSSPPSISDPTNYGSTWRIVGLRGQFGRSS